ncbi:MAG: hypothetical protein KDK36_05785 [Leptospiraceae bacterium]|nr:hypothetical protein [Leptospiraceae bacterium]
MIKSISIFLFGLYLGMCSSVTQEEIPKKKLTVEELKKICAEEGGEWIEERKGCKINL